MGRALLLLLLLPGAALGASTVDDLKNLLQQTTTARAHFAQIVLDSNMRTLQRATGTMQFSRPGKFRWEYDKPYQQTIVGDGARVWIYDKDLNQVTVRKVDVALGSSPAALLAGADDIETYFSLNALGKKGRLDWLEVRPYDEDSLFDKVRMGFFRNTLEVMELYDHFGQTTTIKLSKIERNPVTRADTYTFTIPDGADVVTE